MEPLSTIALLASLALPATALPNWGANKKSKEGGIDTSLTRMYFAAPEATFEKPMSAVETSNLSTVVTSGGVLSQLSSFAKLEAGWDGPDSVVPAEEHIEAALDFVLSMPPVFPLPKAMLTADGEVGLYWDDKNIYMDIAFEPEGKISIYSKVRSSGKEKFLDSVDTSVINSNWYFDALGDLLIPHGYALAA